MAEIALVTCATLPDLDEDDRPLVHLLAERGYRAVPAVWDDPAVDWTRFDLSVLRSTWDYTDRRIEFVSWATSVPRLENEAPVVAWNTDKRYLADLAAAGIPVVPTTWLTSSWDDVLPTHGEHVLKPAIGAGSIDAARYDLADADARHAAGLHAARLIAAGKTVLVQPFMAAVDDAGETGVILIDGAVSHAMRKGPMLRPGAANLDVLYLDEEISPRKASPAEIELAVQTVAAFQSVSGRGVAPLYARVDMVPGPDGAPLLMELELTEPSLFMSTAPGAAERFADAIVARIKRGRARAPARRARPQQEREVS